MCTLASGTFCPDADGEEVDEEEDDEEEEDDVEEEADEEEAPGLAAAFGEQSARFQSVTSPPDETATKQGSAAAGKLATGAARAPPRLLGSVTTNGGQSAMARTRSRGECDSE